MNLKQFLKPDWRKIVIIIILLLPSLIIEACVNNLFNCQILSSLSILFLLLGSFYTLITFPVFLILKLLGIPYQYFLPNILVFVINLVYWYLLSCLIIWIYDKVKKNISLKQFLMTSDVLKADWKKIILTIFLMMISFPGYPPYYQGGGFPLSYLTSGKCPIGPNLPSCGIKFIPINLVLDIIILYFLSCLTVWIYNKIKKK